MRGVNKVILVGTLGADPDVKYAANGNAIANLSVATSEEWNDKNTGQKQQKTEWHRVSIFGKLAEISGQYLRKGSQVYLEGKLQTRKWQDQNGQDRYTTEVVLTGFNGTMQMLGGGGGQRQGQQSQAATSCQQPQHPNQNINPQTNQPYTPQEIQQQRGSNKHAAAAPAYAPNDFDDDDVPF